MGRRKLADQERFEIALAALEGREISSICAQHQVSQAAVYKIRDRAEAALREGMRRGAGKNSALEKLERENSELKELVADYAVAVKVLKKNRSPLRRSSGK